MKSWFGPAACLLLALALALVPAGCLREPPTLEAIAIDSPDRLEAGRRVRIRALGLYSDGKERTYGMKWGTSDPALAAIDDKGFLSTMAPGTVMLLAEKDGILAERPLQVTPVFDGLKLHFKRPEDWGEPNVYVYQEFGAKTEQYSGEWTGTRMLPEGGGWYTFSVEGIPASRVIFNDGNIQVPRPGTVAQEMPRGEWWFEGDTWYETDPRVWKEVEP